MDWYFILLIIIGASVTLTLLISLVCFLRIFYSPKRKELSENEYEIPKGKAYEELRESIIGWVNMTRTMKNEPMEINSDDGLVLRGRYYECKKGAPVELLFHGYQGSAERDMSAGVERCFAIGRNAIIIDQRAAGKSDGHVITFGIREHIDCIRWAEFAIKRFGAQTPIILTGISMGAATVLMAAGEKLPDNVACVLADCPYSSPKEIIQKVMRDMKLPDKILYPFARLGGLLFGHFDLEKNTPMNAVKKATVPIIFIHGAADTFVPFEMSQRLFDSCVSEKRLTAIEKAEHGLSYPTDKESYLSALREFESVWMKN